MFEFEINASVGKLHTRELRIQERKIDARKCIFIPKRLNTPSS